MGGYIRNMEEIYKGIYRKSTGNISGNILEIHKGIYRKYIGEYTGNI